MNQKELTKTIMMILKKPFDPHGFYKKYFSALTVKPFGLYGLYEKG